MRKNLKQDQEYILIRDIQLADILICKGTKLICLGDFYSTYDDLYILDFKTSDDTRYKFSSRNDFLKINDVDTFEVIKDNTKND